MNNAQEQAKLLNFQLLDPAVVRRAYKERHNANQIAR
jgi:hypothetical protein